MQRQQLHIKVARLSFSETLTVVLLDTLVLNEKKPFFPENWSIKRIVTTRPGSGSGLSPNFGLGFGFY
jgi:hypothetical protein